MNDTTFKFEDSVYMMKTSVLPIDSSSAVHVNIAVNQEPKSVSV